MLRCKNAAHSLFRVSRLHTVCISITHAKSNHNLPVEKFLGGFLCFVGTGFLSLFAFLKVNGKLTGDITISVFIIGCSAILLSVGAGWLFVKEKQSASGPAFDSNRYWIASRLSCQTIAAIGCGLMCLQAICLCANKYLLPNWLLRLVLTAPILIGLFLLRTPMPGNYSPYILARNARKHSSSITHFFIVSAIRIGWFGHIAVLFYWFEIEQVASGRPGVSMYIFAAGLIALLFASQWLQLHFTVGYRDNADEGN